MNLTKSDQNLCLLWDLIKCYLNNECYNKNLKKEDFDTIFNIARIHAINPILFHVLRNNESFNNLTDTQLYKTQRIEYKYLIYHSLQQDECIEEITKEFLNNNIKVFFFKGAHLRNYYPVPALRSMGDIDCLILEKDRQTAHNIMCDLGYTYSTHNLDVWLYKKNKVEIEMQSHLAHNGIGNEFDYTSYFSSAFNHTIPGYNNIQLEDEYNLCYLFYHIAKHLSSTGAGIRMILDIAVFTSAVINEIDLKKLKLMLNETHLIGTASAIYALCDKWFDTSFIEKFQLSAEIPDGLEEYIINGGTFGFETHDTGDIYRRKAFENFDNKKSNINRLNALKNFFFPSINYMQQYIPSVKNRPWLLPAAWIKRFFIGLFKRNKHSLNTLNSISSGDNEQSFKEAQMLRKLEL